MQKRIDSGKPVKIPDKYGEPTLYKTLAFVLISCAPAKEHEAYAVLEKISKLEKDPQRMGALRKTVGDNLCGEYLALKGVTAHIEEIHPLFGEYDLITKVSGKDFRDIGTYVSDVLREVPGVINTLTLTSIVF